MMRNYYFMFQRFYPVNLIVIAFAQEPVEAASLPTDSLQPALSD